MAHAFKPLVRLFYMLLADVQVLPVTMNQLQPERAAQPKTDRDPADTPCECREVRQRQRKMMRKDEISRKGEQRLIRHRQPDDAENQQEEDRKVPVLRNPR